MGDVKRLMWEDGLPEVPAAAFSDASSHEIDDGWISDADQEDQVAAIAHWFLARFCDPAEETPCMSSEGGYIWVHGGPYDATEEIEGRFGSVVSEEAIKKAIDLVQSDGIYDWAPTQLTYLDDAEDVLIDNRKEPTQRLERRIGNLLDVLGLEGVEPTKGTARNLIYAGLISAMEAFLNETMLFWVSSRSEVVESIITHHPKYKDRRIPLGSIYEVYATLEKQVKSDLRKVVWHRVDEAASFFKHGLTIEIGLHRFNDEISVRHDIVHRFSEDSNGDPITISDEDVRALANKAVHFANEIDGKIAAIFAPDADDSLLDF